MTRTGCEISVGAWNMLDYYWGTKRDLERWADWTDFIAAHPDHPIISAWRDFQRSSRDFRRFSHAIDLLIKGAQP